MYVTNPNLVQPLEQCMNALSELSTTSPHLLKVVQAKIAELVQRRKQIFDEIPDDLIQEIMEHLTEDQQGNFAITCKRAWAIGQALHSRDHQAQLAGPLALVLTYIDNIKNVLFKTNPQAQEACFYSLPKIKETEEKINEGIAAKQSCCALEKTLHFAVRRLHFHVAICQADNNGMGRLGLWEYCQKLPEAQSEHNDFLKLLYDLRNINDINQYIPAERLQGKYRCAVLRMAYRCDYDHSSTLACLANRFIELEDFVNAEKTANKITDERSRNDRLKVIEKAKRQSTAQQKA